MTTKALVTGGAGFIGSHLVDALLDDGVAVRVLDDFSTGHERNLVAARKRGGLESVRGDIRDPAVCRKAMEGIDCVYHLAALGSVARSVEDPATSHAVNATGTLHILAAARDAQVRRVVLSSSSSVYGDTPTLPKVETMAPSPQSPYAITKCVGEMYGRVFFALYGLETIALRYFNVFGPRQDPDSAYAAVIPAFCRAIVAKATPRIFGDGEQTRDFTYVANAVHANRLAARAPVAACGQAYNVACGERNSLNRLLTRLAEAFGATCAPEYLPARKGDVRDSLAAIDAAHRAFGYRPVVGLEEGLRRTVTAFASAGC